MVPSAARYSVMVRGLPPDVTEAEVANFFSTNYDLSKRQLRYPMMGMEEEGCRNIAFWLSFLFVELLGLIHFGQTNVNFMHEILVETGFGYFDGTLKDIMNVLFITLASYCAAAASRAFISLRRVGKAVERSTPQEMYEEKLKMQKEFEEAKKSASKGSAKGDKRKVYAAPPEDEKDADFMAVEDEDVNEEEKPTRGDRQRVAKRRAGKALTWQCIHTGTAPISNVSALESSAISNSIKTISHATRYARHRTGGQSLPLGGILRRHQRVVLLLQY